MRKTVLSFSLVSAVLFMSFVSNNKPLSGPVTLKEIESSVVKLNDKLYAGKYEVSNRLYLAFEQSLKKAGKTEQLKTAMVDSVNWRDKLAYNEPYVDYYYRHPAYANYPMVNISYDAAQLFCQWLTDWYNADAKRKYKKVVFRLPTESEWVMAAQGGNKGNIYSWGMNLMKDGLWAGNFRRIRDEGLRYDTIKKEIVVDNSHYGVVGQYDDAADITAPVDAYKPNGLGIFNTCGNVAEMISNKGIACGGGWRSLGGDIRIDSRMSFARSASDIGFRYFMEIVEE
ncbi:MAG: SUMF1/EgtB/PvdO family nonheme iron enzyme [Bacteroidota bacterium]